jgi:MoxR-like ATPase
VTYSAATPAPTPLSPLAPTQASATPASEANGADTARAALHRVRAEIGKVIVGQDPTVTGLIVALICRGHVLLEGVPGVAKTLLVRTLAAALALDTKRMQFTPDLMPSDVTGSLIMSGRGLGADDARPDRLPGFEFRPGPVFTNLFLADEINRTPPKTQASLLEVMEERQVSVDGTPRPVPEPFLVAATQNPVEYEGTYPLPEAQLDRFLFKLTVPLPSRDEEFGVLRAHHRGFDPRDLTAAGVTAVATGADIAAAHAGALKVQAADVVLAYIVDLCRATRTAPSLELGASPRGATGLLAAAKAYAWFSGREHITPDDVKAVARPVLRHRVRLRHEAEIEGITADAVLESLLATVPAPR